MGALRAAIALLTGIAIGVLALTGVLIGAGRAPARAASVSNGDSSAPYDVGLVLTERFLRDELSRPSSGNSATAVTFRDADLRLLASGEMQVRGTVSVWGIAAPARAVLVPRVEGGRLSFGIKAGQLGGFALPPAAITEIERRVNARLDETMGQQPFEVVSIEPGPGTLGVHLRAR